MLSCLYLKRARSKPNPEPGGPPPSGPCPCVFRRPNVRARYSRRRGGKAPRAPKNQSASRRPAGPPSDPPLFPIAFSRSLLELAVQGVLAEVRVVLHELQALGGVAAVLRASERREGRIRRTASVSLRVFFLFDSKPGRVVVVVVAFERVVVVVSRLASGRLTRGGVAFSRASSSTASRPARERFR